MHAETVSSLLLAIQYCWSSIETINQSNYIGSGPQNITKEESDQSYYHETFLYSFFITSNYSHHRIFKYEYIC
jgi:hypothetical protein